MDDESDVQVPSRRGRVLVERKTERARADALALINERLNGKQRKSRSKVFCALFELCADRWAKRGSEWVSADRHWLAERAGVHVETLDAAVQDLEKFGLVQRQQRRLRYAMSLPNLWRLAGCASLVSRKADTSTEDQASGLVEPSTRFSTTRSKADSRTVRRTHTNAPLADEYRWGSGPKDHPALAGLPAETREIAEDAYELCRSYLIGAGSVQQLPEGPWLAAIRDWLRTEDEVVVSEGALEDALRSLAGWLTDGHGLAYSFRWMHPHRRKRRLSPRILFGLTEGDPSDHSGGRTPFWWWAELAEYAAD